MARVLLLPGHRVVPGRDLLGAYMFSGSACSIRYGDLECQKGQLFVDSVAQTPWTFTKDPGGIDFTGGPPEYLALVDDQDVIHGTGVQKVESLLERLAGDQSHRSLQFYNCCIPMMTGDDVRGPLARFQARTGWKVVFSDMSPMNCHQESLSRHILGELSAAHGTPSRALDGRFNLAGFRRTRGRDELVGMLAEVGAELNAAILPQVAPESLADYREATVQALMPNHYYREVYEVLEAQGLRTLRGCAPYGRDGTVKWLRGLCASLGGAVAARLEASLAEIDKTFQPEWDRLRQRAAAHRAGFVVGPGDAARLADPARSAGVSVPALLAEMGFSIDFLAFQEAGCGDDAELEALRASLPGAARHAVVPFRDRDELLQRFRAGGLAIVYSNVRDDHRLTHNGLVGFSLRDLEMGLAGTLRSLTRLVERCELPFFRENSRRLRGQP